MDMSHSRQYRHYLHVAAFTVLLLSTFPVYMSWARPLSSPLFARGEDISVTTKGAQWTYRALRIGWAPDHQDKRHLESELRTSANEIIRIPEYGNASVFLRWYDAYPDPKSFGRAIGGLIVGFGQLNFSINVDIKAVGATRTGVDDEFGFHSRGACSWEADEEEFSCTDQNNWVMWLSHGLPRSVIRSDAAEASQLGEKVHIVKLTPGVYILTLTLQADNAIVKQRSFPVAVGKVSEEELRLAQAEIKGEIHISSTESTEKVEKWKGRSGPSSGLYRLEEQFDFNVLDRVEFDADTGHLTLTGHLDPNYATERIPYLQHLAELLEHPNPAFSLEWTAESERKLEDMFTRMDSPDFQDQLIDKWTAWFGADGRATKVGKAVLPLLGIQPTATAGVGGLLGIQSRYGDYSFIVTGVFPDSAAARADLRVGDEISLVNERQFSHLSTFVRFIHALGAGAEARLDITRSGRSLKLTATLDAAPGDPWKFMDRYALIAKILHGAEAHKAGQMVAAVAVLNEVLKAGGQQQSFTRALHDVFLAAGTYNDYVKLDQQGASGAISLRAYRQGIGRLLAVSFDAAFDPYGRSVTVLYDRRVQSGMDYQRALELAFTDADPLIKKTLREALPKVYHRRDEILIPTEIVSQTLGIRPMVRPEYLGFNGQSQLARVLFHADYLAKSIVNKPELADSIPGYKTEFSYYRSHPRRTGIASTTVTERLWISVDKVDLAQSSSGHVLKTGAVEMRFNIRDMTAGGDREIRSGDYETLLTSQYDDFARHFPVFHELRETAKLTAVANWIKTKYPELQLPKHGRATWSGPQQLPGLIFFIWATRERAGVANVQVMAPGGVSLRDPACDTHLDAGVVDLRPDRSASCRGNVPVDAAVVDLRPGRPDMVPAGGPRIVTEVLRPSFQLPVPRPVAWISGDKTAAGDVTSVTIDVNNIERDAPTKMLLGQNPMDAAVVLWKMDDLDATEQELNRLLQEHEGDPQKTAITMLIKAQVLHEMGNNAAAEKVLKEATLLAPDDPVVDQMIQLMLAQELYESNDKQGAIKHLKEFLAMQPSNTAAANLLAEMEGRAVAGAPAADTRFHGTGRTQTGRKLRIGPVIGSLISLQRVAAEKGDLGIGYDSQQQYDRPSENIYLKDRPTPTSRQKPIERHNNYSKALEKKEFRAKLNERKELMGKRQQLEEEQEQTEKQAENEEERKQIIIQYQLKKQVIDKQIEEKKEEIRSYVVEFDEEETGKSQSGSTPETGSIEEPQEAKP